jgi:hypothetical protein
VSIFGKTLAEYARFVRVGIILILLMGVARFIVGVSGVPYEKATHFVSITLLTLLLALVYGHKAAASKFGSYRQLLPATALLAVTMYGFIILAILVESLWGIHGYFHSETTRAVASRLPSGILRAPAQMSVAFHITGQLIAMPITTAILWGIASLGFRFSRRHN